MKSKIKRVENKLNLRDTFYIITWLSVQHTYTLIKMKKKIKFALAVTSFATPSIATIHPTYILLHHKIIQIKKKCWEKKAQRLQTHHIHHEHPSHTTHLLIQFSNIPHHP